MTRVPSPPMGLTHEAPFPQDCAARYRFLRRLGRGGFGAVFEAVHRELGRRVAVKLLLDDILKDQEQVARFANEGRVTAAIRHPNVIQVLDAGAESGIPWIAYELVEGRSLGDRLEAGGMPLEEALDAVAQVCDGLAAAHAAGVIHRDIKPENVLDAGAGVFKIMDFGIASWSRRLGVKTQTGVIMGTPAYLAPEHIDGAEASPSSDVYAVGVMLFELLTGAPPYRAVQPVLLLQQHLDSAIPRLADRKPGLPDWLEPVVRRALAKNPVERYPSALALRTDLLRAGEPKRTARTERTVLSTVPAHPPRVPRAGVAVCALAAVLVLLAWSQRAPAPVPSAAPSPLAASSVTASPAPLSAEVREGMRSVDRLNALVTGLHNRMSQAMGDWRSWRRNYRDQSIDLQQREDVGWKVMYLRASSPEARANAAALLADVLAAGEELERAAAGPSLPLVFEESLVRCGRGLTELGACTLARVNPLDAVVDRIAVRVGDRWIGPAMRAQAIAVRSETVPALMALREALTQMDLMVKKRWLESSTDRRFVSHVWEMHTADYFNEKPWTGGPDNFRCESAPSTSFDAWINAHASTFRAAYVAGRHKAFESQIRVFRELLVAQPPARLEPYRARLDQVLALMDSIAALNVPKR